MLNVHKWKTTEEDFNRRKEKAIMIIKDLEFRSTNKLKFKFTEKQLREEFVYEDADKIYDKYDDLYFDGNFILYPKEKIIIV